MMGAQPGHRGMGCSEPGAGGWGACGVPRPTGVIVLNRSSWLQDPFHTHREWRGSGIGRSDEHSDGAGCACGTGWGGGGWRQMG